MENCAHSTTKRRWYRGLALGRHAFRLAAFGVAVLSSCAAPSQEDALSVPAGKATQWGNLPQDFEWYVNEVNTWLSNTQCSIDIAEAFGSVFVASDDPELPDPPLLDHADPHVVVLVACRVADEYGDELWIPFMQIVAKVLGPSEATVQSGSRLLNRVQVEVDRIFRRKYDDQPPPLTNLYLAIADRSHATKLPDTYRQFPVPWLGSGTTEDIGFLAYYHEDSSLAVTQPEAGPMWDQAEHDAIRRLRGLRRTSQPARRMVELLSEKPWLDGWTENERFALSLGLWVVFAEIDERLPEAPGLAAQTYAHWRCLLDYWVLGYLPALFWDQSCGRAAVWPKTPLRDADDDIWVAQNGDSSEEFMQWYAASWLDD